jgi:APA family basic amino acid/polyamine antiporter
MVPIGEMATVRESRIATEAAVRMIGPAGGAFVAVAILVSTLGCVNGLTLAGARVVFAMGRDGLFFRAAARVHPGYRTPAVALALHGLVAAVLTLTGTYSDLLTLTAFSSLLFNVLTIVGLFVLRVKQADLHRPYRVWGYPVLPALYVLVSAFFLVYIPVADPRNAGLGLGITALGLPAYLYWRARA